MLSVDGREVDRKSIEHGTPVTFPEDESFDIGRDTRTGVVLLEYRYDPPLKFNGKIDKVTFDLKPEQTAEGCRGRERIRHDETSAYCCRCLRSRNRGWITDSSDARRSSITRRRAFRSCGIDCSRDWHCPCWFGHCLLARTNESLSWHVDLQRIDELLSDLGGRPGRMGRTVVVGGSGPARTDYNPFGRYVVHGFKDS